MTLIVDRRFIDANRCTDDVLAWLADHDLDPHMTKHLVVDGDDITARIYVPDVDGRRHLDPSTGDVAAKEVKVTPIRPLPIPKVFV